MTSTVTWVLLRGLTREASHWGNFPQLLAQRLGPAHRVLALDLPGAGSRHRERSPTDVAALAAACRAALARTGTRGPCMLVALSLGGMVALEWARVAPGELRGCVLINTSAGGDSPMADRLNPRCWGTLMRLLVPGVSPQQREALVLAMTSSDPARHAGIPQQWAAIAAQRPVSRANALRQLLAAARYAAPARAPGVPLVLLASAGDNLVSARCSQRLARRWGVPLHMHPSAGHDLPLDAPDWLLRQLHLLSNQ